MPKVDADSAENFNQILWISNATVASCPRLRPVVVDAANRTPGPFSIKPAFEAAMRKKVTLGLHPCPRNIGVEKKILRGIEGFGQSPFGKWVGLAQNIA